MTIVASDIKFYKSGSSCLGGTIGDLLIGSLNEVFDNVSSAEALVGATEYRCLYVKNSHGSETLTSPRAYQTNTSTAGLSYEIGWGTSAISGTEQTIASETVAPIGVSFTSAAGSVNAVALGSNLTFGQWKAIWVKRIVGSSTAAAAAPSVTLTVQGDTTA